MRVFALASAVTLIALGATEAAARTFYVIQSGSDGWTVMDPEGIEIVDDGRVRRAWTVRIQRNITNGVPPQPGYVRSLNEYRCADYRMRWREFSAFSRSGALLVSKVNPNPEWGPVAETVDTRAEYRVVCEGAGEGSVISAESVAKVVITLMGSWDPPPMSLSPPATEPKR
ncbi:MAG: surface-adhesin E family protein [Pseudomonadota bacterium]|jgi:hypothetical protein